MFRNPPRRAAVPAQQTHLRRPMPPHAFARASAPPARPPGTAPCALLAADGADAEALAASLSARGYAVVRAGCAAKALAVSRSGQRIDLVVLHGALARSAGLLKGLRAGLPGVRIVLAEGDDATWGEGTPPRRFHA